MIRTSRKQPAILTGIALLLFSMIARVDGAKTEGYQEEDLRLIARMSSGVLEANHFRKQPLDEALSERLFDDYFKALDPSRIYFTADDIEKFTPMRKQLCEQLKKGDDQFALAVYQLYQTRNSEFRTFAEQRLQKPFDFTIDETFELDREKAPWPVDHAELEKLWEKRLKNEVLYYRLFRRAFEEEQNEEKNDRNAEKESDNKADIRKIWEGRSPEERVLQRLRDVNNDIVKKERIEILGIYLNTLAQIYGPHSNYLPPALDEDFDINMRLSLIGIGATLTSDDGYIKVVSLVPGGPAAQEGHLKEEDRIIAVTQQDGSTTDLIDMPVAKAVRFIRGEENTKVTLTVLPAEKGRNAVPENITITRAKVKLVDSAAKGEIKEVKTADGGVRKIGVINLPSFYSDYQAEMNGEKDYPSCSNDVKKLLREFEGKQVDAVVMDVRRNGGGYLTEAIRLTGLFITTGPVVQVQTSDRSVEVESDNDPEIAYRGPLVVLTSKLSASSTEIFAGAIRDLNRGILAGDSRTFGKGTVLNVYPLDRYPGFLGRKINGGSTTFETAMFFRPSGGSVQQLGIEPDVKIPSLTEELEIGELFLDNHLPWNSLKALRRDKFDAELNRKAQELRKRSEERIASSKEFALQQKRIERFNAYKDRKSVSLNEETRWREYREEKAIEEETASLYREDNTEEKVDPVLGEALAIAADLSELEQSAVTAKQK